MEELEEEHKEYQATIVELKRKIQTLGTVIRLKQEIQQFELAEKMSRSPKAHKDPDDLSSQKVMALEMALEKERQLRVQEKAEATEKIAGLEAELTVVKVELSVAQL